MQHEEEKQYLFGQRHRVFLRVRPGTRTFFDWFRPHHMPEITLVALKGTPLATHIPERLPTPACVQGKDRMHAKAQKQSIVSISRSRSIASTMSTGGTTGTGGTTTRGVVGSTESGSVGIVRLGIVANATPEEAGGKGLTAGDCGSTESGSVGTVRLGSLLNDNVETGQEATAVAAVAAAADGTAIMARRAGGDSEERGGVGIVELGHSPKNVVETGASAAEETTGATVGGENDSNTGEEGGVSVGKDVGSAQGGQAHVVRLGTFARSNTRMGRVDHKFRRSQQYRRKAHHYLMSLTYSGLQPGMDYHIRVAGISSVGQVFQTVHTGFLFLL